MADANSVHELALGAASNVLQRMSYNSFVMDRIWEPAAFMRAEQSDIRIFCLHTKRRTANFATLPCYDW